jgi:hypothetical protein
LNFSPLPGSHPRPPQSPPQSRLPLSGGDVNRTKSGFAKGKGKEGGDHTKSIGAIDFFSEARRRSKANERRVLDELLEHEDDPLI